jgi:hypothetical protein
VDSETDSKGIKQVYRPLCSSKQGMLKVGNNIRDAVVAQMPQDQILVGGLVATQGLSQAAAAAAVPTLNATQKTAIIDGFKASIKLPPYATDDKMYCPAYPAVDFVPGPTGPYNPATNSLSNDPIFPSRNFKFCWTAYHEHHTLSKSYGGGGLFRRNTDVNTMRTMLWENDDKLEATRFRMNADYLKYGSDFVNLIKDVRAILLEDTKLVGDKLDKTDGDLFPTGIPFVFWEQYVELMDHMLKKSTYAGIVCLCTVTCLLVAMLSESSGVSLLTLIVASLHGAILVVLMCMLTMIEIYGFMGIMKIKLNAIPQVTLIMAIGMTVEFTAHILLAYLNAPNPPNPTYFASRKARTLQALAKMGVPSIHGAITTFLGIVMLANANSQFIVMYYFMLYFLLVIFGIANGLFVLPAFLVVVGPVAVCSDRGASKSATVAPKLEGSLVHVDHTPEVPVVGTIKMQPIPALES